MLASGFIRTIIVMGTIIPLIKATQRTKNQKNWAGMEAIAEDHPYIVALLNKNKMYMCTGTIISKQTVLTAGSCIKPDLYYVAVGAAVISKSMNNNSLILVAYTKEHSDYINNLKVADPRVSQMQNNIGLVFSLYPVLANFLPSADLSNYFASEMQGATLTVFGYGLYKETGIAILQGQTYRQSPCINPKWYYCICGSEFLTSPESEFGMGGPVLFNNEIAGVAVSPCGHLTMKSLKYNVFTITGAYLPWIEKMESNTDTMKSIKTRSISSNSRTTRVETSKYVYIVLIIIKSSIF